MLGLTSHKTKTNKLDYNNILIQHFIMLHAATLLLLVLVVLSVVVSTVQATGLTAENFDAQTDGKTVFLKFYAPWCGHCKSMAPDWDKLMTEYADHAVALVGEVDCTNDANDQICEEFDVQGFPTIKWGSREAAEDYNGGRDYESLAAFAKDHITVAACSVSHLDACSAEEQKAIADIQKYDDAKLEATVQTIKEAVLKEEEAFDTAVNDLQATYETMTTTHNAVLDTIKAEHQFKYVSQIMKQRGLALPSMDPMDADGDLDDMMDDDDDDDDDSVAAEL